MDCDCLWEPLCRSRSVYGLHLPLNACSLPIIVLA